MADTTSAVMTANSTGTTNSMRDYMDAAAVQWNTKVVPLLQQIAAWPMVLHVVLAVLITWTAGYFKLNLLFVCSWMIMYLWKVDCLQKEKDRASYKHEVLRELQDQQDDSEDEETVKWLNQIMEQAWPMFIGRFVSLRIVPMVAPWFLDRYKPWALSKLILHKDKVNMGSTAPIITSVKVYKEAEKSDDHVRMEMGVVIHGGKDMSMEVTANVGNAWSGLGLVPWTAYATDIHLEGRLRMRMKFKPHFPFVERVTISFVEQPKVKLSVRVLGMGMAQGFDAASLPLVADYVDSTLANALKNSIIAPNMLVIDNVVELLKEALGDDLNVPAEVTPNPAEIRSTLKAMKSSKSFLSKTMRRNASPECPPIARVKIELLAAKDLVAMDRDGASDPFIKGSLGQNRFKSSIQKHTLNPRWDEEFVAEMQEGQENLTLKVRDFDQWSKADKLGTAEVNLANFADGLRHEMWLPLGEVNSGVLLIAVTVTKLDSPVKEKDIGEPGLSLDPQDVQSPVSKVNEPLETYAGEVDGAASSTTKENNPSTLRRRFVRSDPGPTRIAPGISVYAWD